MNKFLENSVMYNVYLPFSDIRAFALTRPKGVTVVEAFRDITNSICLYSSDDIIGALEFIDEKTRETSNAIVTHFCDLTEEDKEQLQELWHEKVHLVKRTVTEEILRI